MAEEKLGKGMEEEWFSHPGDQREGEGSPGLRIHWGKHLAFPIHSTPGSLQGSLAWGSGSREIGRHRAGRGLQVGEEDRCAEADSLTLHQKAGSLGVTRTVSTSLNCSLIRPLIWRSRIISQKQFLSLLQVLFALDYTEAKFSPRSISSNIL